MEATSAPATTVEVAARPRSLLRTENRRALLLIAPVIAYLVAISIYPLGYAFWQSLRQLNLFNPTTATFYGIGNYRDLWNDQFFLQSLKLTLIWSAIVVSIEVVLGFGLARLLDRKLRGVGLLRTLIVIPVFVSPVGMGLTWRFMYDPASGVINWALRGVGLPGSLWLSSRHTALISVMIADIWQWTPFVAVILLAAMQSISPEIIEAARLDNLRGALYLRRILLPLVWPVLTIVVLIRLVDSVRLFDLPWVMTGGGPGSSTLLASVDDYSIFQGGNLGQTAAMGFVILVLVNLLVIAFLRVLARQSRAVRVRRVRA